MFDSVRDRLTPVTASGARAGDRACVVQAPDLPCAQPEHVGEDLLGVFAEQRARRTGTRDGGEVERRARHRVAADAGRLWNHAGVDASRRIAGLVLAAGAARSFGSPKQLAPVDGRP